LQGARTALYSASRPSLVPVPGNAAQTVRYARARSLMQPHTCGAQAPAGWSGVTEAASGEPLVASRSSARSPMCAPTPASRSSGQRLLAYMLSLSAFHMAYLLHHSAGGWGAAGATLTNMKVRGIHRNT
jgi:hypothetical protein